MASPPVCEARIACDVDACSDCVHVLQSVAEMMAIRAGMAPQRANRVALAVDELFANITRHGYVDGRGRVEMEAVIASGGDGRRRLTFTFRDYAPRIEDPGRLDIRQPGEHIQPGGLGLCLIHAVMDEVHHQALEDGNRWHLTVHLYERKGA
jgi:serine/threonine-protein kinase RsbW